MDNPRNDYILTISKEELTYLPHKEFHGDVVIINDSVAVLKAISELSNYSILGFDTETRPVFRKGVRHEVALIQIASREKTYLFRINKTGMHKELVRLFENENVIKVGVSIHDDFLNLSRITEIHPESCIDLQHYVKAFNIVDNGLQRIYGILFGERISKSQRLSNWEANELTTEQINYAALDAVACLDIYNYLRSGKFHAENSPYLHYPEIKLKDEEES